MGAVKEKTTQKFQAHIYCLESRPGEYRIAVDTGKSEGVPGGGYIPFHRSTGYRFKDEIIKWIKMQSREILLSKLGTVEYDESCKMILGSEDSRELGKLPILRTGQHPPVHPELRSLVLSAAFAAVRKVDEIRE
jgi:hypothetical protein